MAVRLSDIGKTGSKPTGNGLDRAGFCAREHFNRRFFPRAAIRSALIMGRMLRRRIRCALTLISDVCAESDGRSC